MEPARWQLSQDFWKIGAMSLEKVGVSAAETAAAHTIAGSIRLTVILTSGNIRVIIQGIDEINPGAGAGQLCGDRVWRGGPCAAIRISAWLCARRLISGAPGGFLRFRDRASARRWRVRG